MQTSIIKVGVLRGGAHDKYNASLKNGGDLISHINEYLSDKYKTFDILVDKNHLWHINGLPINPSDLMHRVDIVWNTSHPSISNILSSLSVPYIDSSNFDGATYASRDMLKEHMAQFGAELPRSILLPAYQEDFDGSRERYAIKKAKEIHQKFGSPWIVKSFNPQENMGIHLAKTFPELVNAIEDGLNHGKSILVEEFITGKVAAVHSIKNFRDREVYTFPLGKTFGSFSEEEREKLNNLVHRLHELLNNHEYIKTDFVLHPRGRLYVLGISTHPNIRPGSHFSEFCESIGLKTHNVIDHILGKLK